MPPPADSQGQLADFIRARLPLRPTPGIAEIRLHKAEPDSGLRRFIEQTERGAPYWAHYWGGGLALARHVLDRPDIVRGRRVLDLGAGSGLVAIAAALAGAASVSAAEIDDNAIVALGLNLTANGIDADIIHRNLLDEAPPPVDIILVGDLFYERRLAARVIRYLDRCADAGIDSLIGDPYRAFLPRDRLLRVAELTVAETPNTARPAAIFRLRRDGASNETGQPTKARSMT